MGAEFGYLLDEVAQQNKRMSKFCINYMTVCFSFCHFIAALSNSSFGLSESTTNVVLRQYFPNDIHGWFCFFKLPVVVSYITLNGAFMSFFISFCNHYLEFYTHFQQLVQRVDKTISKYEYELQALANDMESSKHEMKIALRNLVEFHILVKE